jgi:RNA polymerase sigma factor (sigma-70 family)
MAEMNTKPKRVVSMAACAVALASSLGGAGTAEASALDQVQRYCATSWRNAGIALQEWPDCTQEALAELLERVPRHRLPAAFDDAESTERRELNRAIWRIVQRWRRQPHPLPLDERTADPHSPGDAIEAADSVATALRVVTPRQRDILVLWSEGWSVSEIGRRLGISAARVSDEKYKAIARIRRQLDPDRTA